MLSVVHTKARGGFRTPSGHTGAYEQLSVMLGIELGSSAKEVSTLNCGAISLAAKELVLSLSGKRWGKTVAL